MAGTGATAAAPASAPSQLNPVTDGRFVTLTLLAPFENGFDADAPAAACGAPPEEKGLDAEAGGGAENGFAVLNGLFAMTNQRGKERGRGERGGCREDGARDWRGPRRVVVLGVRCWKETVQVYPFLSHQLLNYSSIKISCLGETPRNCRPFSRVLLALFLRRLLR